MSMNGVIYSGLIAKGNEAPRDAMGDQCSAEIVVTKEVNGYAVWRVGHNPNELLAYGEDANDCIEQGVTIRRREHILKCIVTPTALVA